MPTKVLSKQEIVIDKKTTPDKLVELILNSRGIADLESFFNPPYPIFDFDFTAIKNITNSSKNILIYGDYDVDGVTATAILWQALHKKGLNVTPFVPDREHDGYGFRSQSFLNFEKEKKTEFDLVITVDNGIVATNEFQKLKELRPNLKIIVTDHHLPDSHLNDLRSIIDDLFHSPNTSGAALSWFLAKQFDDNADLGLAALGVVADCMPLVGINRSLVVHGLRLLRLDPCPGIKKLMEVSRIKQDEISAYHLGFMLGPRINAVGRLSNPTDALRLLCAPNVTTAAKYAAILDDHNRDRQALQKDSLDIAESCIPTNGDKLIFVADHSYLPGIIGLVAGRLTEKCHLPSVVISLNGEVAKGSCRSIPQLNIIEALRQFSDLFVDLGGHAQAAGFSIKEENIPMLQHKLTEYINKALENVDTDPALEVDAHMSLSAVTIKNYQALQKLEPFGIGNPEPIFLFKQVKIVSKRLVGSTGDHLSLKLDDPETKTIENTTCSAIAFKKGELDTQLSVDQLVDVVAQLSANTWNGLTTPQLIVKEILS